MRKLAFAVTLAMALAACGGDDGGSPTEPSSRRGNWIGTISGTHAGIRLQGTCQLEMLLDPNLNTGRWWIDCPDGASSQGQVAGVGFEGFAFLTLISLNPLLDCPFDLTGTRTAATIEGDFEVTNCDTNAVLSRGTFSVRLR
ncbi:MAG TPA: hypothetical protein VF789_28945 [Thermoanaerobaculia bacterium]